MRRTWALGLIVIFILPMLFPMQHVEGSRTITTGETTLKGTWINETAISGSGFVFSNATIVAEGYGEINIDGFASKIYVPLGGGIRNMGKILLDDIAQAPTTGYVQEIDLSNGDWVDACFCVYTPELKYAKFQIVSHTYISSPNYGDPLGSITIRWYFQDDGSRSFMNRSGIKVVETSMNITNTVSCYVKASTTTQPTVQAVDIEAMPEALAAVSLIPEIGEAAEPKVLATVDITSPGYYEWIYIEISYSDEDIKDLDLNTLAIYYYNESSDTWMRCERTGVDAERNVVWANVTHLTIFAAIGKALSKDSDSQETHRSPLSPWIISTIIVIIMIPPLLLYFAVIQKKKHPKN